MVNFQYMIILPFLYTITLYFEVHFGVTKKHVGKNCLPHGSISSHYAWAFSGHRGIAAGAVSTTDKHPDVTSSIVQVFFLGCFVQKIYRLLHLLQKNTTPKLPSLHLRIPKNSGCGVAPAICSMGQSRLQPCSFAVSAPFSQFSKASLQWIEVQDDERRFPKMYARNCI